MAGVIWAMRAQAEKRKLYLEGRLNFGTRVANKTAQKIESIQKMLESFPNLGYREPLLTGLVPIYRTLHINKRFKIIYCYDKANDTVVIEDIWDMHREPQNLIERMTS